MSVQEAGMGLYSARVGGCIAVSCLGRVGWVAGRGYGGAYLKIGSATRTGFL